jgi:hypothetical protein
LSEINEISNPLQHGECVIYLWDDQAAPAVCQITRHGRLGWCLSYGKESPFCMGNIFGTNLFVQKSASFRTVVDLFYRMVRSLFLWHSDKQ